MQPISVTVGPLASAVTTSIGALQLLPAAGFAVLNGGSGTASAATIAAAQQPAGAGNLTLKAGAASLGGEGQYIYITTAADETLINFTVTGTDINGATVTEVIKGSNTSVTSSAKKYKTIKTIAVDGATTGNVSVGTYNPITFAYPCQITITPTGDESTNTYTVTGIDVNGSTVTETIAGKNASASTSALTYAVVTSVKFTNAPANAFTIGNAQSGSTRWVRFDDWAPSYISIQCVASGTVNYTVQYTMDDPNSVTNPIVQSSVTWVNSDDADVVAASASAVSNFIFAPIFARVNMNSGSGTVRATFLQSFGGV